MGARVLQAPRYGWLWVPESCRHLDMDGCGCPSPAGSLLFHHGICTTVLCLSTVCASLYPLLQYMYVLLSTVQYVSLSMYLPTVCASLQYVSLYSMCLSTVCASLYSMCLSLQYVPLYSMCLSTVCCLYSHRHIL